MINELFLLIRRAFSLHVLSCQADFYRLDVTAMGLKYLACAAAIAAVAMHPWLATAADVEANITALTGGELEADWTNIFYSKEKPLLLGNDGGAATGGFHAWDLNSDSPLSEVKSMITGRTKIITTVYNVTGKDYAITIAMPDSIIRVYEMPGFTEIESAQVTMLGDWAAMCSWRTKSLNDYVFLFGKSVVVQYLVRPTKDSIELVEVRKPGSSPSTHFSLTETSIRFKASQSQQSSPAVLWYNHRLKWSSMPTMTRMFTSSISRNRPLPQKLPSLARLRKM